MKLVETKFICGQCGKIRKAKDVYVVSETDFCGYGKPESLAKPAYARKPHYCGFLGIRCKEHPNAFRLAEQAVYRHLRRNGRVKI